MWHMHTLSCRISSNPTTRGSKLLSFTRFPTRPPQFPPTYINRFLSRSTASLTRAMTPTPWMPNQYPPARRSDHVDVYKSEKQGEVRVADPYQWLEKNTKETDEWTSAQDAYTRSYLDKNSDRAKLEKEIRANTDYEKVRLNMDLRAIARLMMVSFSSPRRFSSMMTSGTGTITAAFRHSQVCRFGKGKGVASALIPFSALQVDRRQATRLLQGWESQGRSILRSQLAVRRWHCSPCCHGLLT